MPSDNSSIATDMSTNSYLENCHPTTESSFTGRKGMTYDWHSLLMPSDEMFKTEIENMLISEISALFNTGEIFSPNKRK